MKYLAIPQKTAEWLVKKTIISNNIVQWLQDKPSLNQIGEGVITYDSIRITSIDNQILCIWNNDYLIGSGDEKWGVLRLEGELGLYGKMDRFKNTFEDFIFIVSKRLQGLKVTHPSRLHLSLGDHLHAVSNTSRKDTYHIIFKDITIPIAGGTKLQSLISTGTAPDNRRQRQISQILDDEQLMEKIVKSSNYAPAQSKSKPILDIPYFSKLVINKIKMVDPVLDAPELKEDHIVEEQQYLTIEYSYEDWIAEGSPLNEVQRSILFSNSLLSRPIRIMGAAGTGKSLLMQLLAIKRLKYAEERGEPVKIIYICHNNEMSASVTDRFDTLGAIKYIVDDNSQQKLIISTLFEYCVETNKDLSDQMIMSTDAYQNKEYQKSIIARHLGETIDEYNKKGALKEAEYPIISQIIEANAREVFIEVVANEIGVAIKGRIENFYEQLYTESEAPLSRLHSMLNVSERQFIYKVFSKYHDEMFVKGQKLDSDDVAISFLQLKKTPIWNLQRQTEGFDFVFIDETQLFNDNERQLFSLITKTNKTHVPIAIALDEAQDLKGGVHRGFASLGIPDLDNKVLTNVHRCTQSILNLAFHVIQRTTDLFGSEFPNFTNSTVSLVNEEGIDNAKPLLVTAKDDLATEVLNQVTSLRTGNNRKICVVIHSNRHWNKIMKKLQSELNGSLVLLERRGEVLPTDKPTIALARPESVGGQEFEVVISVGLEDGVVPERVSYQPLQLAFEQQALR
ncbi:MAG: UvrD-helicase domain-containing protein, partial [Psychroserpens sp.]|nr:UvrD-helicase domain-containing protein [Psychroserpens sp.]